MDLVMHLTKCSDHSMVASVRIAKFISKTLGIPLIDTPDKIKHYLLEAQMGHLDKFILVNSPTGFAEQSMREGCATLSYLAKDPIFAQNDYKMKPPSQCKSFNLIDQGFYKGESSDYYGMRIWGSVPQIKTTTQVSYINWNMLTYSPPNNHVPFSKRNDGVVYWGALRKGREKRLQQLLIGDFKTTLSTAPQSFTKFKNWLPDVHYVSQFKNLNEDLSHYKATVYTQDESSDNLYCSLANRFYEALASGVAIFIDDNCRNTFMEAGIQGFEKYLVNSAMDIEFMIDEAEAIAAEQMELWGQDYKAFLTNQLGELYADI